MTANSVARYMAYMGCTSPECMQDDEFTHTRLMNLMLIAQGLSIANVKLPNNAYLFSEEVYLTNDGVQIQYCYPTELDYIDEDGYVRVPEIDGYLPRRLLYCARRELCRDVLRIFRDWTNEELCDFVKSLIPPLAHSLVGPDVRFGLDTTLLGGVFTPFGIQVRHANDGERVTLACKNCDGDVRPETFRKPTRPKHAKNMHTRERNRCARENTCRRYCRWERRRC